MYILISDQPNQMSVSWVTPDIVQNVSYVEYGLLSSTMNHKVKAVVTKFINIDTTTKNKTQQSNRTMWIYKAKIDGLKLGTTYSKHKII